MLKAKTTDGDVWFGLSHENIRRLRAGDDIYADCFPIEIDCRILIKVVPATCPIKMVYAPAHKPQAALAIALPDNRLDRLLEGQMLQLYTKRTGASFDLYLVAGATEQAIIKECGLTGRTIRQEGPRAPGVH